MSPRVGFFVDGFNLYHSLATYAKESGDHSVKWLDLIGLAKGSLHAVSYTHLTLPTILRV